MKEISEVLLKRYARLLCGFGMVVAGLSLTACDREPTAVVTDLRPQASAATEGALLAQIRAATARFHRVEVAAAEGYVPRSPCFPNEGVHYQNPGLVDAVIDPEHPEVLLYETTNSGELRLIGVEFVIPSGAWDATHTSPPMLGDQPFMDRRLPPFGAPFPNYALYVWVWRENPDGIFTYANPKVTCRFGP